MTTRHRLDEAETLYRKARRSSRWLVAFLIFTILATLYNLVWSVLHPGDVLSWVAVVVVAACAVFTAVRLLPRSDMHVARATIALDLARAVQDPAKAAVDDSEST